MTFHQMQGLAYIGHCQMKLEDEQIWFARKDFDDSGSDKFGRTRGRPDMV